MLEFFSVLTGPFFLLLVTFLRLIMNCNFRKKLSLAQLPGKYFSGSMCSALRASLSNQILGDVDTNTLIIVEISGNRFVQFFQGNDDCTFLVTPKQFHNVRRIPKRGHQIFGSENALFQRKKLYRLILSNNFRVHSKISIISVAIALLKVL